MSPRRQAGPTTWGDRRDHRILGQDVARVDGPLKLTGQAKYTHDIRLPGMLWARILCCPYPVAHPVLDLEPARAIEGVKAVIPLDRAIADNDGWTSRLGQPIAAVAATSPEAAEDGLRAIVADYELGKWALTYDQAVAEGAPKVSPEGNVRRRQESGSRDDAEIAYEECDEVVEATYTLPVQVHACLETHGVVVDFRGGDEATIYASTQGTFTIAGEAARVLGLSQNNVTCIVQHMGGGFGSKFGLDIPGMVACMLAKETSSPVHLMLTRADEFQTAGNRSASRQTLRGGVKDGKFRVLISEIAKLGGVGLGSNPGQPYIYAPEVHYTESVSVHTNTDSNRAMRAPGHPQASFAIESMVDELAHASGLDPLEFRKSSLESPVYTRQLDRVAAEIGWADHPNKLGPPEKLPLYAIGIGFGVSTWGSGGRGGSEVDVRIEQDGSVTSSVGSQDLGTGTRTYVAGIVAEELGIEIGTVEARIGDSRLGSSVASGGSVTVPSLAPAVKDAAHKARLALLEQLAPLLDSQVADLVARDGQIFDATNGEKRMSWKEACACLPAAGLEVRGTFQAGLAGAGVHGAQAARVGVDTLTGEAQVLKMVCIQDCGLPLNRLATRSQINGGMIQGMSYGLWEEHVVDPWLGLALNNGFEDYKVAGTMDMPELVSIIDDDDDRDQVLGIGEPPVIPGHSAVANAIFNACGVRLRDMPLSRDKIIMGLAERG